MPKQEFKALTRRKYLAIAYAFLNRAGIGSISELLGVTQGIAVKVKKHSGVVAMGFPNPARTGTKLLSTKEVEALLSLRAGGMSAKGAGELFEISAATVSYIEDEALNVPAKLRFGTHEAKLARAQFFAAVCPAAFRNAVVREFKKNPDARAVARAMEMDEYRVRAVLSIAGSTPLARSALVQGRSDSGRTTLQCRVRAKLSPAQRNSVSRRLGHLADAFECLDL